MFSLNAQLDEIDYELKQRERVYERLNSQDPKGKSERDFHMMCMRAVRDTIQRLVKNEKIL
jgi:hypothetical protein